MKRFILQENIKIFRQFLAENRDIKAKETVRALLNEALRELMGLGPGGDAGRGASVSVGAMNLSQIGLDARASTELLREIERSPIGKMVLDPRAGFHIIDTNDVYTKLTLTSRDRVAGARLFDIFPDNPDLSTADGVSNLYQSLRIATETGRAHTMAIQRYDIRDRLGVFVERHWLPINTPVFSDDGRLLYIVHEAEDVTARVLAARARNEPTLGTFGRETSQARRLSGS